MTTYRDRLKAGKHDAKKIAAKEAKAEEKKLKTSTTAANKT